MNKIFQLPWLRGVPRNRQLPSSWYCGEEALAASRKRKLLDIVDLKSMLEHHAGVNWPLERRPKETDSLYRMRSQLEFESSAWNSLISGSLLPFRPPQPSVRKTCAAIY